MASPKITKTKTKSPKTSSYTAGDYTSAYADQAAGAQIRRKRKKER
jgi:hypothetical protein